MNKGQDDKVGNTSDAPATAMVGMRSFAIRDDASLAMNRMISPDSDTTAASTARTMKPAAAWTRLPSSTQKISHTSASGITRVSHVMAVWEGCVRTADCWRAAAPHRWRT